MPHPLYGARLVFGLIWVLLMLGWAVVTVIITIAIWRLMRAHESIARTLDRIAGKFPTTPPQQ